MNLGWPASFSNRFTTETGDFEPIALRKCKKECVTPPPTEEELINAFLPTESERENYATLYGKYYPLIWKLVRNPLKVDPTERNVNGAGALF